MTARLIIALGAFSLAGAFPALAAIPATKEPTTLLQKSAGAEAPLVFARHGADDGADHDRNDDHGKKRRGAGHASAAGSIVLARHGADDGADHDANDDHGGRRNRGGRGRGRNG